MSSQTRRPGVLRRTMSVLVAVLGAGAVAGVVLGAPSMAGWGDVDRAALAAGQVQETVVPATTTLSCPAPVPVPEGDAAGASASAEGPLAARLGLVELSSGAHDDVLAVTGAASDDGASSGTPEGDPIASLVGASPLAALAPDAVAVPGPFAVRGTAAPGTAAPGTGASGSDAAGTADGTTSAAASGPTAPTAPAQPVAAVGYSRTSGDLSGLVATACPEASTDQWLVGGSTEPGSSATLALDNPGETTVTVDVTAWGAAGRLGKAGATTAVVPPLGHKEIVLATLAPAERRLAVHVTATGGVVGASVAVSRLDGTVPRGVTVAVPGAAPAVSQVVPGVVLQKTSVDDADGGVVRLLATTHRTTAAIRVLGPRGRVVVRGADTVDLRKGQVTDVPLAGLPAGQYTVVVTAGDPVVAGVQVVHEGADVTESSGSVAVTVGRSADVAWVPSSTLVRGLDGSASDGSASDEAGAQDAASGPLGAQPTSAVAVPSGLVGYAVLTALPADPADDADLGDVPIDYGDGTPDPRPAVDRGTLTAYDASGTAVGSQVVSMPLGSTVTVPLATLAPGAQVASVVVTSQGAATDDAAPRGADLVWSLVAGQQDVPGGVSVIAPRYPEQGTRTITVRSSTGVGR